MRFFRFASITALILLTFGIAQAQARNPIVIVPAGQSVDVVCGDNTIANVVQSSVITIQCSSISLPSATPTSVSTNTPVPTDIPPTDTPIVPTGTPIPTDVPTVTDVPVATDTPTSQSTIAPTNTPAVIALENYPLCSFHDANIWHGLIDSVNQCHYNHTHDVNPNAPQTINYLVNSATGKKWGNIEDFTGKQIGYIWQTTGENVMKHEGYHVTSALDLPCEQQNYLYLPESKRNCILAFRGIFHAANATIDGPSRFHSYSLEVVAKDRTTGQIGYMATGGIGDTDDAHSPYKTTCVTILGSNRSPCPSASVWVNQLNNPPYWAFTTITQASANLSGGYLCRDVRCESLPSNRMVWENISMDRTDSLGNRMGSANHIAHVNARQYSASAAYNPATQSFVTVCPDGSCRSTGDSFFVYAVAVDVLAYMDADKNGWVESYHGYTDRAGNIDKVGRCTAVNVECVPLIVENMRVGTYVYDSKAPFLPPMRVWGDGVVTNVEQVRYFDTTPKTLPKSWIAIK